MKISDAYRALKLIKKLEEEGMVSAIMPPKNFFVSDKLDVRQASYVEKALVFYARFCFAILIATDCAKLAAAIAAIAILVKAM